MRLNYEIEQWVPWSVMSSLYGAAADLFEVETWKLIHVTNKRRPSHARFAIMWAMRQYGIKWVVIGRWLGMGDHTAAIHGVKVATILRENDPEYARLSDLLLTHLRGEMAFLPEHDTEAA